MSTFSITWRRPGNFARLIIIIIIYAGTMRFAPHEMVPVILGSLAGGVLTAEPSRSLPVCRNSEA